MTCDEFRVFAGGKICESTRASRAVGVKHIMNCPDCQRWLSQLVKDNPDMLPVPGDGTQDVKDGDMEDPEFRQSAGLEEV
jgi:hypothetical protein